MSRLFQLWRPKLRRCHRITSRSATTERCSPYSRHAHLRIVPALVCSLLFTISATNAAIDLAERAAIYAELQEPTAVHLANRRTIHGYSIDVSLDHIQVATAEGAGEAIYTFNINQVRGFTIPGESYKTLAIEWIKAGEFENALELLQMLYLQRLKLIPLLPASESHFFTYYVDLILDSPNPARAIAVSEILKPQITNPAAIRVLDDAILKSYNALQIHEKSRPLAESWVAGRSPYDGSALGYYVLGASHLRAQEYEHALRLALKPIVFSSPSPKEKLAHCYAIAICAALELRDKTYATTLYHEMRERTLAWPTEDRIFATYFKKINQHLEKIKTIDP